MLTFGFGFRHCMYVCYCCDQSPTLDFGLVLHPWFLIRLPISSLDLSLLPNPSHRTGFKHISLSVHTVTPKTILFYSEYNFKNNNNEMANLMNIVVCFPLFNFQKISSQLRSSPYKTEYTWLFFSQNFGPDIVSLRSSTKSLTHHFSQETKSSRYMDFQWLAMVFKSLRVAQ